MPDDKHAEETGDAIASLKITKPRCEYCHKYPGNYWAYTDNESRGQTARNAIVCARCLPEAIRVLNRWHSSVRVTTRCKGHSLSPHMRGQCETEMTYAEVIGGNNA